MEEPLNVVYVDETGGLLEAAELDIVELDAVEERLEDRDVV